MVVKVKKAKKAKRMRGTNSHGGGARGKRRGSGHRGGIGNAGTGKKADQKTTLITAKYGHKYFGKQGITSRRTAKKKLDEINLRDIQNNLSSMLAKFGNEKKELVLKTYKILGEGELKEKLTITAKGFTPSAKEKIEKAGGKWIMTKAEKTLKESTEKEISKKVKENK